MIVQEKEDEAISPEELKTQVFLEKNARELNSTPNKFIRCSQS